MQTEVFRALKNLNLQTELLEAFDWDEDALTKFNLWLIDALNASVDLPKLQDDIQVHYSAAVWEVVKKILKSEMENIHDDKIKKGKIYEA